MSRISSFHEQANVVVIGASGGIGSAACALLDADPRIGRVFALSRSNAAAPGEHVTSAPIDIENEESVAAAAAAIGDTPLDAVLVLSGLLHAGDDVQPERRLSDLDPAMIGKVFAVNAIGPAIVAKHFLPMLRRRGKTVFGTLSARVGSIGDNRLGGWASYRASKAALNQFVKTLSIEQARMRKESILVSLHPGTVDTSLSKPFTGRTPADKLFTPEQSAAYLLDVINGLTPDDTGGFFAWDGSRIDY